MTRIPPQSDANDPLARTMREICVHISETADEALLLRPILLLIAAALTRLFARLEDLLVLWREGKLPPMPVRQAQPSRRSSARSQRPRQRHHRARRPVAARPIRIRGATTAHAILKHAPGPQPLATPRRRIDRYPKCA